MKKVLSAVVVFSFISALLPSVVWAASATESAALGITYLRTQQQTDGSIAGFSGVTDWAAMAFSADSIDLSTVATSGGQTLLENLTTTLPSSTSASTDWSRKILAATIAHENPYNFNGVNLVQGLESYYTDNQIGSTTADNDDMFALLALVASKVDPASTIVTDTTTFIIDHQHGDGGFSYATDGSTGSDIDDTAAALMALTAAKQAGVSITNLETAIGNAKAYVLSHQNADGGFAYDPNPATSWDTSSNLSSTSWVLMAFTALGLGSQTQALQAEHYLISAQQSDGSFPYQPTFPPGDTFDTSYVVFALEGAYWPLHVYTGTVPTSTPVVSATGTLTPTPIVTLSTTQGQSTDSSTTPTPSPTSAPTVIPTPTAESVVFAQLPIVDTPTPSIRPTQAVLGTHIAVKRIHKIVTPFPVVSLIFFLLGMGIVAVYVFRLINNNYRVV